MAKGAPDFFQFESQSQYAALGPVGELAARLEPFMAFDRRGDLFWIDSFEKGTRAWALSGSPAGWTGELVTDHVRLGGYALHLQTAEAASALVQADMNQASNPRGRVGLASHVALTGEEFYFNWQLRVWRDTLRYNFRVRWYDATTDFEYLDSSGAWQTLYSGFDILQAAEWFMPSKLVVDPNKGEYVRFLFANLEVDMTGIAAQSLASDFPYRLHVHFDMTGTVNHVQSDAWIDSVLLSGNEPAS